MLNDNYDVNAAVAYLNVHARGASLQWAGCVSQALHVGGMAVPRGFPVAPARSYGPALLAHGFVKVLANDLIVPRKGDVAVVEPYASGHYAGYLAMYNGQNWVPDLRQKNRRDGRGHYEFRDVYKVYRWQQRNDPVRGQASGVLSRR